jgi:hypothetical protein
VRSDLEVEEARRQKLEKVVSELLLPIQGACVIAVIWLVQKVGRKQDGLKGEI